MDENIILIDWLSLTSKYYDVLGFQELLGLAGVNWVSTKGAHGYKDRLYFNGISIHFNGRDDMGVWCEMSGQGCRAFETFGTGDYQKLFDCVFMGDCKITRIDIAYDDHTGILDIQRIANDCLCSNYVSRLRSWDVRMSNKGTTIGHGSEQSLIYIRIYDKAAERNCAPGTHWIRVEMELHDDRAYEFLMLQSSIGDSFCGVLCNYLRYVVPDEIDSNKSRWAMADYWADLLCGAQKIKLYKKPGIEYNIDRCEHYVYQQSGNAVDALIQIYGSEVFLQKLKQRGTMPNPKYDHLVELYGNGGLK